MAVLRARGLLSAGLLVLSGCTSTPEPAPDPHTPSAVPEVTETASPEKLILSAEDLLLTDSDNSVITACDAYEFQGSSDFVVADELLIEDMCSQGELDSSLLDLRVGENILDKPIGFYVDAVLFHLNYFDGIAEATQRAEKLVAQQLPKALRSRLTTIAKAMLKLF